MPVIALLSVLPTTGCSEMHWPLRPDDAINFMVKGGDTPIDIDGDEFRASTTLCIRTVEKNSPCGSRVVPEGYDDDVFIIEQDELGSYEVECGGNNPDVEDAIRVEDCGGLAEKADEGMVFRAIVNDSTVATVTMPARTRLTSPKSGSAISVSSMDGLDITWSPGNPDDKLQWALFESYGEHSTCGPVFPVVWSEEADGVLEDTGSFTIAKELLPTNLPPEGCSTDIVLTRTREGVPDHLINGGYIFGKQFATLRVTLKP
jgi:hypothetical protein